MWTMDPRCEETVQQAWLANCSGSPMFRVSEKIKASRKSLHHWSKQHFGSVRSSIEVKTRQLKCEEAAAPTAQNVHQEEDKVEMAIMSYYKSLFTSSNPMDLEEVLDGVTRVVSTEMNDQLIRDFTACEVEQALFQMGPLKAPGPDDDSVLFCRATLMECNTIMEILRKYERASGQQINQDKTTLLFSASTAAVTQEDIKNALQLPMWRKVQGWKEKLLTQAGKEILIKAVIQAIPTYTMHCFKLPKKLCYDLEGIIRNFWWGHKGASRKVHWMKWSSLCWPKCLGGMGFRKLMKFNEALLAKQVWRLFHNKESLIYKVFKAKFFPHGTIMDARHSARASYAWKSILNARHVITKGTWWRIGNGLSTKIWSDKWLPPPSSGKPLTPPCILPHDACFSTLILDAPGVWKQFWKRVWSVRVPHKIQQFLWRACTDSLPTMVNMQRRCIVPTARCSFYQFEDEDVRHTLWSCPVLTPFWASHVLASKLFRHRHFSFLDILSDLFMLGTADSIAELMFMLWLLWNRHNQKLYRNEFKPQNKWKPPSVSAFKVNFDATLFNEQQWTGVGVIIRDGQGLPIAALCKRFSYLYSVDDVEALAAREALQFSVEIGFQISRLKGIL
uniref:Reverse transcriptase zinc-binding domain-containing protein n=1 Tax=Fagus sylvatica TaxID=28930 RepID=A0A2N9FBV7_FAGSY